VKYFYEFGRSTLRELGYKDKSAIALSTASVGEICVDYEYPAFISVQLGNIAHIGILNLLNYTPAML
jgi:hypothetical protein